MSEKSVLVHFRVLEAKNLPAKDRNGFSDPYVKLKVDGGLKKKTMIRNRTTWPVWNEDLTMVIPSGKVDQSILEISVWDYSYMQRNVPIGNCLVPLKKLKEQKASSRWYQLMHPHRVGEVLPGAQVRISIVWDFKNDGATWKSRQLDLSKRGGERDTALTEITESTDVAIKSEEKKKDFMVHIVTWNVGNAPMPEDLEGLVPKENKFDIISIGTQECKYKPRKGYETCMADFVGSLKEHLKDKFELLVSAKMWQICQAVFVRKELRNICSNVTYLTEATGIAHVFPNKGGTVVTFSINDLTLAFVNSHLAAHQDKTTRRNQDVAEIIEGIRTKNDKTDNQKMDISSGYHHVFWNGDLNYRLDYGDQGHDKEPSAEQFKEMTEMIKAEKYGELFASDQLTKAMEKKEVFIDWNEGKMDFPPTFKVARSAELEYNKKRSPAWCDRILWKSLSEDFPIRQLELGARLAVATSDHKPVYSTFAVADYHLPCGSTTRKGECFIQISNLKGKNLPAADSNGLSDPYVQFRAPFIKGSKTKTTTIHKSLNPEWKDSDVPPLQLTVNNPERLAMSRIFVRVFDEDRYSKNDYLCSGSLFLQPGLKGECEFSVPLFKGGLPSGEISGKLSIQWHKRDV